MAGISKKTEEEIKEIIFSFLNPKEHRVFIFGSRITGKAKKFSDYDIGILAKNPVPGYLITEIEEALEESDLPYNVDIVDFSLVSPNFKKVALAKVKEL